MFTGKRFRPALIPTVATIILFPVLISLGMWQLDRAENKRELQAEYDRRAADAPVRVGSRVQPVEELRFYRVTARGYYRTEHQILIDNRVQNGRVGYFVVTPLQIENSDMRVLVNRGWIPLGQNRQTLPDIPTPKGVQHVEGLAAVPMKGGFRFAEPPAETGSWKRVWPRLDLNEFRAKVDYPVQPVVILMAAYSKAGGFERAWRRLDTGIAVHHGYAFQWFLLALVLLVIFFVVNMKPVDGREKTE
ncbi:MAG: hypothetical protein BMS9Abin36_1445 [Gammaproteobacteria bacterium]|nr:MAG: hypothetical protein BMS9Abin36_1445 [Gammaproteobacteria bacterium]